MGRGIVGTLKLAGTLVFAIPVGLLGLQLLVGEGPLMGAALLVIAVGMVAIEEYVTTPRDVPAEAAQRAVSAVAEDPDEE